MHRMPSPVIGARAVRDTRPFAGWFAPRTFSSASPRRKRELHSSSMHGGNHLDRAIICRRSSPRNGSAQENDSRGQSTATLGQSRARPLPNARALRQSRRRAARRTPRAAPKPRPPAAARGAARASADRVSAALAPPAQHGPRNSGGRRRQLSCHNRGGGPNEFGALRWAHRLLDRGWRAIPERGAGLRRVPLTQHAPST
jgi:hypothetical protein